MGQLRPGMIAGGSTLALLALFAAVSGCAEFKALFARQPATPAAVVASSERLPAIRPAGGSASAHYRLARFYVERGRHHEAMKEFKKAIEADPTNAKAWNGLGVSLDALGRYADASQSYAEALRLDPSLDYVHNNLGSSLAQRGDHAAAAAAFEKAVELNPGNAVARGNLAKLSMPAAVRASVVAAAPETQIPPPAQGLEPPAATVGAIPAQTPEVTSPVAVVSAAAPIAPPPPVVTADAVKAAPATPPAPAVAKLKAVPPVQVVAVTPPAPAAAPVKVVPAFPAAAPAPVVAKAPAATPAAVTPPASAAIPVAAPAKAVAAAPVAAKGTTVPATSAKVATPKQIAASAIPPPTGIVVSAAPDPSRPDTVRVRVVSAETLQQENPLELANESGSPTLLGAVTATLAAKGYRVEAVKESAKTKRTKTLILYREGALQPAYQVAQAFPGYQEIKRTETFDRTDSSVRVLLGRDMEAHRKSFAGTTASR
jgi:tetratricopeptide (TPR) repeat protein